jgi:hypothetical protein
MLVLVLLWLDSCRPFTATKDTDLTWNAVLVSLSTISIIAFLVNGIKSSGYILKWYKKLKYLSDTCLLGYFPWVMQDMLNSFYCIPRTYMFVSFTLLCIIRVVLDVFCKPLWADIRTPPWPYGPMVDNDFG